MQGNKTEWREDQSLKITRKKGVSDHGQKENSLEKLFKPIWCLSIRNDLLVLIEKD